MRKKGILLLLLIKKSAKKGGGGGKRETLLALIAHIAKKNERGGNLFALFTVCGRGKRRVVVNAFNFFSYPISFLFCVACCGEGANKAKSA